MAVSLRYRILGISLYNKVRLVDVVVDDHSLDRYILHRDQDHILRQDLGLRIVQNLHHPVVLTYFFSASFLNKLFNFSNDRQKCFTCFCRCIVSKKCLALICGYNNIWIKRYFSKEGYL